MTQPLFNEPSEAELAEAKSQVKPAGDPKADKLTFAQRSQKAGTACKNAHGPDYFREIGRKGGQRLSELFRKGREAELADPNLSEAQRKIYEKRNRKMDARFKRDQAAREAVTDAKIAELHARQLSDEPRVPDPAQHLNWKHDPGNV